MLKLHIESGVGEVTQNTPRNYFAPKPITKSVTISPPKEEKKGVQKTPEPVTVSAMENAKTISSKAIAEKCTTVEELREAVMNFTGCGLQKFATNTVFADGDYKSGIMFIGEAPGKNEDLQGIPFCGASGKLLDLMLGGIDLNREKAYITNTIFWRPPGNRKPTPEEVEICRPFLKKHIALVNPKILICVGATATHAILDTQEGISKLVDKTFTYTNEYMEKEVPVRALYHPSYLLRQPGQKRHAWRTLLEIKEFLDAK